MTPKQPPRLAELLVKLVSENEHLVGDLQEEFRAGRSRAWYWRQTAAVLSTSIARPIDLYEFVAVQGMFMQVVMLALISVCAVFSVKLIAVVVLNDSTFAALVGGNGAREVVRLVLSFVVAIPIGVAIARVHAHSRWATIIAFATIVPVWAFANLYLLDGRGNLDSALPHVISLLVFVVGMLRGAIDVDYVVRELRHSR
jgi:hypothetical protein